MHYKPDWEGAEARWTALWRGEPLDRPCLVLTGPATSDVPCPPPPADPRDRYLDPDWVVRHARFCLAHTWWGGDAVPTYGCLGGWSIAHGARCGFAPNTIWHDPIPLDTSRPPAFRFSPAAEDVQAVVRVQRALAELAGEDGFMVGQHIALPANDLIAAIYGTETVLMAMLDHGDWLTQAIDQLARAYVEQHRFIDRGQVGATHRFWYGVNWHSFWGPDPFLVTQSDISCMLSPEQFARFVLPDLARTGGEYGRVWYHLDGPGALHHLPTLLRQEWISVIQWVPGAGNDASALRWLDVLRRIQAAGKIATMWVRADEVEPLLRNGLDPRRLVLHASVPSPQAGQALLDAARRRI